MLRKLFSGDHSSSKQASQRPSSSAGRIARHSSGWGQVLRHFKSGQNLRVLDIGPTSSNNINYLTGLGHSIYMADLVEEAANPRWVIPSVEGEPATYDAAGFIAEHMDFSGRTFDAVLLWDALDFLPAPLAEPVVARIHEVTQPGALVLAFFHSPARDAAQAARSYHRYHLTDEDLLQVQAVGSYPASPTYNNRAIEKLFTAYSSNKFLLAKDSMREVVVTR